MTGKKNNQEHQNPNLFFNNFLKGLGPMADSLKNVSEQFKDAGIDKQYQFSFKAKDGSKKQGTMIVFKPSKSITIDIQGITDEEIKEILHLLNAPRKEEKND